MKTTGIIRKIDELGRIVIPKELRKTLKINVGDSLEVYTEKDGAIVFKKYSPVKELGNTSSIYLDALIKTTGLPIMLCDRDFVVNVAGAVRGSFIDRKISEEIDQLLESGKIYTYKEGGKKHFILEEMEDHVLAFYPITVEGKVAGAINVLSSGEALIDEADTKALQTIAITIGKQIES